MVHQPQTAIVVSENGLGRYQQDIRIGRHRLIGDEPIAAGGDDAGPAPMDLVVAGLGACTSMTLRMYAERKQYRLTAVRVELTHSRIRVNPGTQSEHKADHIVRTIHLQGDLTHEQSERLLEIANRCPVYRTLQSQVHIDSVLAGSPRV